MKQNKILTNSILFVLCVFLCSCYNLDNRKPVYATKAKDTTIGFAAVDTFPSFKYAKLERTLQPAKQNINDKLQVRRDSLLSIYLEDNVHCPNYCEGIFQYTIQLKINETGQVDKVTFEEDRYNSDILQKLVADALKKIRFEPAIKNNKNVSVSVTVNVLIDLYNYPSKIRQALLKE